MTDWIQAVSAAVVALATVVLVIVSQRALAASRQQAKIAGDALDAARAQRLDLARDAQIIDAPVLRIALRRTDFEASGLTSVFDVLVAGGGPALDTYLSIRAESDRAVPMGDELARSATLSVLEPGVQEGLAVNMDALAASTGPPRWFAYDWLEVTAHSRGRLGARVTYVHDWGANDSAAPQGSPGMGDRWMLRTTVILPVTGPPMPIETLIRTSAG